MKIPLLFTVSVFASLAAIHHSKAATVLANYPFTGSAASTDSDPNSTASSMFFNTNTLGGTPFISAGVVQLSYAGTTNRNTTAPTNGPLGENTALSEANSVSDGAYISFSVAPGAAYVLNLSELKFNVRIAASGGANGIRFFVRSDAGTHNFTTTIGSGHNLGTTFVTVTADLSSVNFQNVSGPITFRLYYYDRGSTSGTTNARWELDNVILTGSAILSPETPPGTTVNVSTSTQLVNAVNNGAEGNTINIAAGTYDLTASLKPKPNMTIQGAGASATILRNASSWNPGIAGLPDNATSASSAVRTAYLFDFASNDGITLSNMTLDGTKKLHGAIYGAGSHALEIHDLIIKNYIWSAIRTWSMQGSNIFNNQFIDAGDRQGGITGGMIYGTWTNTTLFFDNTFTTTGIQGPVYGIKGREFRNVRISNNTILVGTFSIELPHENDHWVEIDHNYMDGSVSIPKGGGGGTIPTGGYTFHIHHNYFTKSYAIESARRGVIIEYNLFDFDVNQDGGNLISNWTPTIQGPMTMRHNLIKNPGRGVYWSDQIYNNLSFHNNHVIANQTATPRTEGFFGMPTTTDFSTITIKDNIFECIGQTRPLVRNAASNSAVIQNNTLINISGTGNYANPNTGAPRGPNQPLLFTVGAFDSHQVDGWNFGPITNAPAQIHTSADSHVVAGFSSTNYGSANTLLVKNHSNAIYHRRAFLKFDLSSMSANATQAFLVLKVQGIGNENVTHRPLELRAVSNDSWIENGVTWANQPALGAVIQSFTITSADVGTEIAIDVTSYINEQRGGDGIATFGLVQPVGGNALVRFHSRESSSPPKIEINP